MAQKLAAAAGTVGIGHLRAWERQLRYRDSDGEILHTGCDEIQIIPSTPHQSNTDRFAHRRNGLNR
ncbi:putative potassium transporter 13 [Anopheles sinensis]|uniref:Putative potassium transporter 13 n=1 Tax=Anopheles sinensis TaxID=74873 RepID=A0A084WF54_ANOSI|nr:putative potassium transporter 13 [Anopheles sinensis]